MIKRESSATIRLAACSYTISQGAVVAADDLVPEALLSRVVDVFDPRRVILVGSRARGDAREDSDYDLVVVLEDEVPDDSLSARRRYEGRRGLGIPADIIPCREGVLNGRARAIGSFAHTVLTEGVVVYERS
jgi:predicted nucleotidyltransferase